jgi:hypothetical protein
MGGHPSTGWVAVNKFQRLTGRAKSQLRLAAAVQENGETVSLNGWRALANSYSHLKYVDAKAAGI